MLAPVGAFTLSVAAISRGGARRERGSGVVLYYERGAEGISRHI